MYQFVLIQLGPRQRSFESSSGRPSEGFRYSGSLSAVDGTGYGAAYSFGSEICLTSASTIGRGSSGSRIGMSDVTVLMFSRSSR